MNRIRLLFIFAASWMFFITNVEWITAQTSLSFLSIDSTVFILSIGMFVIALAFPETNQFSSNLVIWGLIGVYSILQFVIPYENMTLETVILHRAFEIAVLLVSYYLAYGLSNWFVMYLHDWQEAVFKPAESLITSMFTDVEQIEKKISRARRFENELAIVYVDLSEALRVNNLASAIKKRLFLAHLAEMLQLMTNKSTTKTWYNDKLVLCIPAGVNSPQVATTIENVEAVLGHILKLEAEVSTASFPQDGIVLSDLVENATDYHRRQQSNEKRAVVYTLPQLQSQSMSS